MQKPLDPEREYRQLRRRLDQGPGMAPESSALSKALKILDGEVRDVQHLALMAIKPLRSAFLNAWVRR